MIDALIRRPFSETENLREGIAAQIIVRTLGVMLLMAALLAGFLWVAARKADELSINRQQHVIATILEQNFRSVPHDQEISTVWDDSVRAMRARTLDKEWIDANLGIWLHTYYGHDEIFIVDARDRLVYAMREGRREDPAAYARSIGATAAPLIAELRAKMRRGIEIKRASSVLTPGAVDLATIHGRPAIVSVKPIVTDSGELRQAPGSETFHISVRYLDGDFIADQARRYQLADGHFAISPPSDDDLGRVALRTAGGKLIGYFVWDPFRPGSVMLTRIAPALVVALLLFGGVVAWLLRRIRQATRQLVAAQSHVEHIAHHDPLTGLANRVLFEQQLTESLAASGPDREVALLYVDLDHFKNINDHLGHPTGDLLIRATSRILGELAPADIVARLGGDEFAIIHEAQDAAASAESLARHIQKALAKPIDLGDGEVLIGASIGIAMAPADGTDAVDLIRKADIALYDAKLKGRRRHSFFLAEMGERIRERSEIEADLREAMRTAEGLDVVYQPFFSAQTGQLLGAEALVRWRHPRRGALLPEVFIPIAEECGLIEPLSEWVLERACASAARWPTGTISVNLSAVQLRNGALAERVFSILKRTRLNPGRLELEITETSFLESSTRCRDNLGWLRDIGVRIALDDFGTGYSSFKHLRGFEIDRIKIDQSFVSTIELGQGSSPVVRAIVDLARASRLETTAEGVETEQQRRFLTSIGCDILQGFLLSEPIDGAAIEARFAADRNVSPH